MIPPSQAARSRLGDMTPQVWYNERHAPQVCYRMEADF